MQPRRLLQDLFRRLGHRVEVQRCGLLNLLSVFAVLDVLMLAFLGHGLWCGVGFGGLNTSKFKAQEGLSGPQLDSLVSSQSLLGPCWHGYDTSAGISCGPQIAMQQTGRSSAVSSGCLETYSADLEPSFRNSHEGGLGALGVQTHKKTTKGLWPPDSLAAALRSSLSSTFARLKPSKPCQSNRDPAKYIDDYEGIQKDGKMPSFMEGATLQNLLRSSE